MFDEKPIWHETLDTWQTLHQIENKKRPPELGVFQQSWWSEGDLNPRHADFQSAALPTELPDRMRIKRVRLF